MIFRNLLFVTFFATITNHDCHSQLFVKIHTHNTVLILNYIKICNIDNIVSVKSIFTIHGLWICSSAEQFKVWSNFLLSAFLITRCSQFCVTDICLTCFNSGEWRLVNLIHYGSNPALISRNKFRCSRFCKLIFREQCLNTVDTMRQLRIMFFFINANCILQTSDTAGLCHCNDRCLIRVSQNVVFGICFFVKYVCFH